MTVSYQSDVASSTSGGLFRLLWRWRGSVWKLVYMELFAFIAAYIFLAAAYDFLFPDWLQRWYEKVVIVCSAFVDMIPLSFILGFYVSFTAARWWNQYEAIPWPDKLMNNIALYIPGADEESRILRRTLMRYINLTLVLVLRSISIAVKRRFPTKEHLIEAGFMTKPELEMFAAVPANEFNTFWIPCTWFVNLLRDARQECRITDSSGLKLIMEELNDYRSKCGLLWSYDWVSIPLVYTQVVTLSTYAFFVASVFGRQHINPPKYPDLFLTQLEHRGEYYIPVFTILQFLLYMGLLKMGEQLINPFGDDDEDFELNWLIDRHIKVSFLGVDALNTNPPPIQKDNYFDDANIKLPYTAAAVSYKKRTYRGSMAAYVVPSEQQGLVVPDFDNDEYRDPEYEHLRRQDRSRRNTQSRDSLWSAFGRGLHKYASTSVISLDSDNGTTNEKSSDEYPSYASLAPDENNAGGNGNNGSVGPSGGGATGGSVDKGVISGTHGFHRSKVNFTTDKQQNTLNRSRDRLDSNSSSNKRSKQGGASTDEASPPRLSFDPTLGFFSSMFPKDGITSTIRKLSGASGTRDNSPTVSRSSSTSRASRGHPKIAVDNLPKNAILKLRKADPKLTIRPFRSRVTFSEDTKGTGDSQPKSMYHVPIAKPSRGMRSEGLDLTISSPELSEADLLTAYIEHRDSTRTPAASPLSKIPPPPSPVTPRSTPLITAATASTARTPLEEKRKASLIEGSDPTGNQQSAVFPTDLINAIGLPSEYWLRHQSLPNIQEIGEEESAGSPTHTKTSARMSFRKPGSFKRQRSVDRTSPPREPDPLPATADPTASTSAQSSCVPHQRTSQSSPSSSMHRKGSAEERRRRYSAQGSSSNSFGSAPSLQPAVQPISARRYRKRMLQQQQQQGGAAGGRITSRGSSGGLKQSSTESETSANSYKTAKSFYIQISEEEDNNDQSVGGSGGAPTVTIDPASPSAVSTGMSSTRKKQFLSEMQQKSSQSNSSSVASYTSAKETLSNSRPSITATIAANADPVAAASTSTTTTPSPFISPESGSTSIPPQSQPPSIAHTMMPDDDRNNKRERRRRRRMSEQTGENSSCIGS